MPNGPTSTAEIAGPRAKPNTSAASSRPRLDAEVVGIGEDHDAPDGRHRGADADAR